MQIGNGQGMKIKQVGHFVLHSLASNTSFHLHNLMHIPEIKKNLVSVSKFAKDNNVFFEFHPNVCLVKSQATKEILLQGCIKDGLYAFQNVSIATAHNTIPAVFHTQYVSPINSYDAWYQRLGQPSPGIVSAVLDSCKISCDINKMSPVCKSCCIGKMHQLPHFPSLTKYHFPLELVFSDLWGSAPIFVGSGYEYYICFVDAFSRYSCIYLLQNKSQAFTAF